MASGTERTPCKVVASVLYLHHFLPTSQVSLGTSSPSEFQGQGGLRTEIGAGKSRCHPMEVGSRFGGFCVQIGSGSVWVPWPVLALSAGEPPLPAGLSPRHCFLFLSGTPPAPAELNLVQPPCQPHLFE